MLSIQTNQTLKSLMRQIRFAKERLSSKLSLPIKEACEHYLNNAQARAKVHHDRLGCHEELIEVYEEKYYGYGYNLCCIYVYECIYCGKLRRVEIK